jgi:hypothetical protein
MFNIKRRDDVPPHEADQQHTGQKRQGRVTRVAAVLVASTALAVPVGGAATAEARPGTTITCYNFGDFTQCVCVTNGKGEWC